MEDTSGPISETPLAFYDHNTSSWRMSQGTLLSERPPSLQHLPNWGTTQNGALYELPTPAHLTKERGYLSGAKLKTPTASENVKPRPHRVDGDRYDLADQLGKLLPTPAARDHLDTAKKGPLDLTRMFPKEHEHSMDTLPRAMAHVLKDSISDSMNKQLDAGKQLWDE